MKCFDDLKNAYNTGQKIPTSLLYECVHAALHHTELFTPADPSQLVIGQIVTFTYLFPKSNGPWRAGIVTDLSKPGLCQIWTFNLRDSWSGALTGGCRNYRMQGMVDVSRLGGVLQLEEWLRHGQLLFQEMRESCGLPRLGGAGK